MDATFGKGTLKGDLNGTTDSSLYSTARSTFNFGVHQGTGTTLEVTSKDGDRHVKLTGYKEVIRSLSLPDDFLASDKLEKHGGGYLTVNMREETYISRWQLNDLLNGLGWKLAGYTGVAVDGVLCVKEMWVLPSRQYRVKKSPRKSENSESSPR